MRLSIGGDPQPQFRNLCHGFTALLIATTPLLVCQPPFATAAENPNVVIIYGDDGYRGDARVQLDWAVGAILETLEKHELADNTLVIFTSDNGPTYDNGYLEGTTAIGTEQEFDRGHDASGKWRGGKNTIFESGTRVPMIIRWPSRIRAGTTSDALVNQIDFLASFSQLLDVDLESGAARDSRNILSALLGEDAKGHSYMIGEFRNLALRASNWKYIEPTQQRVDGKRVLLPESLFNLDEDPGEQANLASTHPDKTKQLRAMLRSMKVN